MTLSAVAVFLFTWAGLALLKVPLALLSALVCALLTFVPTIGPTAGTLLPMAVALLLGSPAKMLQVLLLRLVLQNAEAFVLTPLLLSRTVNLLPTVALMAQLCLGALLGLPGLLLALPLTNRTVFAWASSGLETALWMLLLARWAVAALDDRRGALAGYAALMSLARPDGLLFFGATALWIALRALRDRRLPACLLAGLLVGAHLLWRKLTYGAWVPNPYFAKVGAGWPEAGLRHLAYFALEYAAVLWPLPIGLAALRFGQTDLEVEASGAIAVVLRGLELRANQAAKTLTPERLYATLVGTELTQRTWTFEEGEMVKLAVIGQQVIGHCIVSKIQLDVRGRRSGQTASFNLTVAHKIYADGRPALLQIVER
jgi:hypothetical protein